MLFNFLIRISEYPPRADKSAIIRINLSDLTMSPLRCAQDDRAVLPAALWPTRAHVRLRLMRIWADKSGLEMHYYLSPRQGPTSWLCLACG